MDRSLISAMDSYRSEWESDGPGELISRNAIIKLLDQSTFTDIVTAYNIYTTNNLWFSNLITLFSDHLINQMDTKTTFILTVFKESDELSSTLDIGYDPSYYIRTDDVEYNYITNETYENIFEHILRLFNRSIPKNLNVLISNNSIKIIGIENNSEEDVIYFEKERNDIIKIPVEVTENYFYKINRKMINSFTTNEFQVFDLDQN